jgi:hypothetical protein
MAINPQIGSPCQYLCDVSLSPNQNTVHAALILAIDNNNNANLLVFPDGGGETFYVLNVPPQQQTALQNSWQPLTTNP